MGRKTGSEGSKAGSKGQFLTEYRAELLREYTWPHDYPEKLATFLDHTESTIRGTRTLVNLTASPAALAAYRAIGGKGRLTYSALRALPD